MHDVQREFLTLRQISLEHIHMNVMNGNEAAVGHILTTEMAILH